LPTNVTREYLEAQQKYTEAASLEEKIEALKLMLSTVPKHKGTERLRYELKKNLAKKTRELKEQRARKTSSARSSFHVPREGIGQVALVGPPNSGKSAILSKMTSAKVRVTDYPFATMMPVPGMLDFEDIQIQLVEVPAVVEDVSDGRWVGPRVLSLVRNADALAIVVDLSTDPVAQLEMMKRELNSGGIRLNKTRPRVDVKRTGEGGINIVGELDREEIEIARQILIGRGFHNATVVFQEHVSPEDLLDVLDESVVYKRAIVIANKGDLPKTQEAYESMVNRFGGEFEIFPISAKLGIGLEDLPRALFKCLEVIRIYTKAPGRRRESRPLVLPVDSTVRAAAEALHKSFLEGFRFARVWGSSVNFDGEMVGLSHVLRDGDTVEFHSR